VFWKTKGVVWPPIPDGDPRSLDKSSVISCQVVVTGTATCWVEVFQKTAMPLNAISPLIANCKLVKAPSQAIEVALPI